MWKSVKNVLTAPVVGYVIGVYVAEFHAKWIAQDRPNPWAATAVAFAAALWVLMGTLHYNWVLKQKD